MRIMLMRPSYAGVDGAIARAGGQELFAARRALPVVEYVRAGSGWASDVEGIRCRTGDAVTTVSGELRADHVIHAVRAEWLTPSG